jgi:hypothetical protein
MLEKLRTGSCSVHKDGNLSSPNLALKPLEVFQRATDLLLL